MENGERLPYNQSTGDQRDIKDTVITYSKYNEVWETSDSQGVNMTGKYGVNDKCNACDKSNGLSADNIFDTAHKSGYHGGSSKPSEKRDPNGQLGDNIIDEFQNGDVVRSKRSRNHSSKIESSAESYTERILRSGTWSFAVDSDRVQLLSNGHKTENTRNIRAERDKCDRKFDSDNEINSSEAEKRFSLKTLTRDQKVILIASSFTNLLSYLSFSILAPFFPIEADKKGVNSTISGWIFGVFALVKVFTSPLCGRLLPIVGCRFVFISGLFLCGGCTLLFGLFSLASVIGILDKVDTSDSIVIFVTLCFVTRILLGLGYTAIITASFVMLVKYFPGNFTTVFGIVEVFTGIGIVTGPALGGFLYAAGGFVLPFAVIGGFSFAALPLVWYFIPKQDDIKEEADDSLSIKTMLLHPRTIVNSIAIMMAAAVWAVLDPTLEPHLRVYGFGPELIGVLFLIMAVFYSVTSSILGRIADKLPDNRTLLIIGLLVCAMGLLLAGPSPLLGFQISFNELWLTIVSLVVLGVGTSMAIIPTFDVYICILGEIGYPEDTRTYGTVSGLWVSVYSLGDFAGPSLGGFLFDTIGFEWLTTWIGVACIATSMLVCVSWFIEKKCCKKSHKPSSSASHDVTEKTALLTSPQETDVLNTYQSGTIFTSAHSSV